MTESRFCSIGEELGRRADRLCTNRYLSEQIVLMPQAEAIAFGNKAAQSMRDLPWIEAYALPPPGANHRPARPSWEAVIAPVEARRSVV